MIKKIITFIVGGVALLMSYVSNVQAETNVTLTQLTSHETPRTRGEIIVKGAYLSHLYGKLEHEEKGYSHKVRGQSLPIKKKFDNSTIAVGAAAHYIDPVGDRESYVDIGAALFGRHVFGNGMVLNATARYFADKDTGEAVLKVKKGSVSADLVGICGFATHRGFVRYGLNYDLTNLIGKIPGVDNLYLRFEGKLSGTSDDFNTDYLAVGLQVRF